jgi:hypothetical protein
MISLAAAVAAVVQYFRGPQHIVWNDTVEVHYTEGTVEREIQGDRHGHVQCGCRHGGSRCTAFTTAEKRVCPYTYYIPMNVTPFICGETCKACWTDEGLCCHHGDRECSGKHKEPSP